MSLSNSTDTIPPTVTVGQTTTVHRLSSLTTETHPLQVRWEQPGTGANRENASIPSTSCFQHRTFWAQCTAHEEAGNAAFRRLKVIIKIVSTALQRHKQRVIEEKARDSIAQRGEYSQKTSSVHSSLQEGTMPVIPQCQNNFTEEMGILKYPWGLSAHRILKETLEQGNSYCNHLPKVCQKECLKIAPGVYWESQDGSLFYCMYSGHSQHGATICDCLSEGTDLMIMDFIALCQSHYQLNSDPYPMHRGPSEALSLLQAHSCQVSFANIKEQNTMFASF